VSKYIAARAGVATATTVTATMGVTGAGVGGRAMARRTGEVKQLRRTFAMRTLSKPVHIHSTTNTSVALCL
jgi:hypothetical protein